MADSGDVQVTDRSGEVRAGIEGAVAAALEEIGLKAEGYAKRELSKPKGGHRTEPDPRPNVDTGALRNSVTHEVSASGRWVAVGTNVEYAPGIELGTSRHRAWPFLRPAASEHGDEYRDTLKRHLQGA